MRLCGIPMYNTVPEIMVCYILLSADLSPAAAVHHQPSTAATGKQQQQQGQVHSACVKPAAARQQPGVLICYAAA